MAEVTDQQKKPIELPWAAIVVTLAAAGGFFLYINPLRTARPVEGTGFHTHVDRLQDTDARLWQDPLRAAAEHEAAIQWKYKDLPNELKEERDHHSGDDLIKHLHDGKCWVLAVMIPGSAYAEFSEARLRIRRAVLEGLGRNDYVPVDGEHIGYIVVNKVDEPQWRWHTMIVPYEFCHRDPLGDKPTNGLLDDVCVIWLRDEEFRDYPLAQLDYFFTGCLPLSNTANRDQTVASHIKERVIGPYSSTTLRNMVEEIATSPERSELLKDVEMWSPTATAADDVLLRGIPDLDGRTTVERVLSRKNTLNSFHFIRSSHTDDDVARKLVDELQNKRHIKLSENGKQGSDYIAVISEWDTLFGRALPWSFRRAIIEVAQKTYLQDRQSNRKTNPSALLDPAFNLPNLRLFNYLRGIDGMLPGNAANNEAKVKEEQSRASSGRESTEGLNQGDYLRRLSNKLVEVDAAARRAGGNGLKAIGVLGADIYDKLLVLQALRRRFPDATFFTNNLDARMAHPDEWRWTRNVLIASPFGLALRDQNVPPFRDSTQTAVYTTTRLIASGSHPSDFDLERDVGPIRLYEIGRRGAFDLTTDVRDNCLQPGGFDSKRSPSNWKRGGILILGAIALTWICWIVLKRGAGSLSNLLCSSWLFFIILTALSVYCIWCLGTHLMEVDPSTAEPYSWIDGISVWPTDTLRVLAILLSGFYIWKTGVVLSKSEDTLTSEFGLSDCAPTAPATKGTWIARASELLDSLAVGRWKYKTNAATKATELWKSYIESSREWVRLLRILPMVGCYFFAGLWLRNLFGEPHGLARGSAIPWDLWLGYLSAFSVVLLTFYVADATLLNRR